MGRPAFLPPPALPSRRAPAAAAVAGRRAPPARPRRASRRPPVASTTTGGTSADAAAAAAASAVPVAPPDGATAAPARADAGGGGGGGIVAAAAGGGGGVARPTAPPAPPLPPLFAALAAESARVVAPFFCPGHKLGRGAPPGLAAAVPPSTLALDLPELPATDCLSDPTGVLAAAATAAAEALTPGAATYTSHPLVNGTSSGVVAAVMAAVGPGETLVLPRNAHSSAVAALVATGGVPRWVDPPVVDGLAHGVTAGAVAAALAAATADGAYVAAVLVVAPTYHGVVADIDAIAAVAAAASVPLLVDEAHGAHFGAAPGLPVSASHRGADAVVQSTHKTGGSLTQSALLHVRRAGAGGRLDGDAVADALRVGTTTSPSWLLLASIDAAVAWAASPAAPAAWAAVLALAADARSRLAAVRGVAVLRLPAVEGAGGCALDPTRLTALLDAAVFPGGGFAADDALIERWGVYAELPTAAALTFVLTPGNTAADVDALVTALGVLSEEGVAAAAVAAAAAAARPPTTPAAAAVAAAAGDLPRGRAAMTPRDAFFAAKEAAPLVAAAGRTAAETVSVYPPGIPLVVPGEVLTPPVLAALAAAGRGGGGVTLSGAADPTMATVRVVAAGGGRRQRGRT